MAKLGDTLEARPGLRVAKRFAPANKIMHFLSYWNNAWARAAGAMESEEEDAGPFVEVGALRLPLKPGTASGYVGVQRSTSKKRPWQATLTVAGRGRLNVGQFKKPLDAAVARAQEKLTNGDSLSSPTKAGCAQIGCGAAPPSPLSACPFLNTLFSLLCSTHAMFSSQAVDCQGPHAPHAAWCEREPLFVSRWRDNAAERRDRARCERCIHRPVCSSAWCAECCAASTRPALASGFGSFWFGLPSPAAEVIWA